MNAVLKTAAKSVLMIPQWWLRDWGYKNIIDSCRSQKRRETNILMNVE